MKFLYIINSALEEIRKQKFIHIILIISIFICTILLNLVSALLIPAYRDISTLQAFKDKDIYIASYSKDNEIINFFNSSENTFKAISEIDGVDVGWTFSHTLIRGEEIFHSVVYTDLLCDNIEFQLKKGVQFHEYDGQYIPVILSPNHPLLFEYDLGSVFTLKSRVHGQSQTIEVQICGILKDKAKYYEGNNLNSLDYNSVLRPVSDSVILIPDFVLQEGTAISDYYESDMTNNFWYCSISEPKGSDEYNAAYSDLCKLCTVAPYREIITGTWKSYSEGLSDIILTAFFIMILSAVGIGSANIYIGKKQMRSFAINFISGAKWSHCLMIDVMRNLIVIVIPTVICPVVSDLIIAPKLGDNYSAGLTNFIMVLVFITVLFAISSLPYIIKLKNTEPIAFVRTMNRE